MRALITRNKVRDEAAVLRAECDVFARYLVGHKPNGYVLAKYQDAHGFALFSRSLNHTTFDELLLQVSRLHPWGARLADTYTSVFCKKADVRKKMILTLAILETCAPSFADFDLSARSGVARLCLGIARRSLTFGLTLAVSAALFLPLWAALELASMRSNGEQ